MNIDDLVKLTKCYTEKCKNEAETRKKLRTIWFNNSNKIFEDYKNKVITRKEFITKINKLDSAYFNSVESIAIHNCEIKECYDLLKIKLDHMAAKINYKKKKEKYTIYDYKKIIINTNKKNNAEIKLS
jgi:hypothetical protein